MNKRLGLLLLNLGTPDAPRVPEVRRYLRQFLSDPRVLDIPALKRAFVLNAFILPFRPRQAAAAYQKVWTERGSPLHFHGLDLVEKVGERLGAEIEVALGMRYQNPSIESALDRFRDDGIDEIVAFPLFPQYASSASGSAIEELYRVASSRWNVPTIHLVPPFYDHPAFLDAFATVIGRSIDAFNPDKVLFSYHGLPERQIRKSDESSAHCLSSPGCCDAIVHANRNCYRAQCYATTRGIVERLELSPERHEVSFQSRLGRDPWIRPFTDERVIELAHAGVKRLAVACPAFVADCLETLEEIGIRAEKSFREAGGDALALVPSLNSDDVWVDAVVRMVRESCGKIP